MAGLTRDIVTLLELQGKLASADMSAASEKIRIPVAMLFVGAVLGLGTVPVLLAGGAWTLAEFTVVPLWGAYLIAAGAGIVLCGLLLWLGWRGTMKGLDSFNRSREEFSRNVQWLKESLSSRPDRVRPGVWEETQSKPR